MTILELNIGQWVLILVMVQRLAELVVAKRNTKRLLANGAHEVGAGHYPLIVILHASWIAVLFYFVQTTATILWPLLGVFLVLQGVRVWVLLSLGDYWTTRIICVPDAPLITHGPYRWVRHPNYVVVIAEIAVLPLAFGLWDVAIFFSIANGLVLFWRIRLENASLSNRPQKNSISQGQDLPIN